MHFHNILFKIDKILLISC